MKVLILLALAALAAAEAEPEADPQVIVHATQPFAPVVLKTAEGDTPVVHAVSPAVSPAITLKTTDHTAVVHAVSPVSPVVTLKTGESTPVVSPYTVFTGYPYGNLPLTYAFNHYPYTVPFPYTTTPFVFAPTVAKSEESPSPAVESARKKREADPQLLTHPVVPYVALQTDTDKPVVTTYATGAIPTVGTTTLTTVPVLNVQGQKATVPLRYSFPTTHPFTTYPYTPITYTGVPHHSAFPYTGFPVVYTLAKTKSE